MSKYIGATVVNLSVDTVDVTGDITATDATPEVIIVNDTHEDTDGGREGKVTFKGQQSGGEETTLAQIQASHDGTSDDEKGDLIFKVNDGSDGSSPTERLRIGSDGATTITTEGNEDTLVLKSNDADANAGPKLQFNRNSASPADDDFLGEIRFSGRNDAGQAVDYAKIAAKLQDASDGTEDIRLSLKSIVAGTERERITIQPTEVVINEDSQDLDFRVESDDNTNMLFVDGANDVVVIGSNVAENRVAQPFAVTSAGVRGGMTINSFFNSASGPIMDFQVSRNNTAGSHTVVQTDDALGTIIFRGDDGDEFKDAGAIECNVDATPGNDDMSGRLCFFTAPDGSGGLVERMRILSGGRIHIADSLSSNGFGDLSSSGNILQVGIGSTFGDTALSFNTGGFSGDYDLVVFRNANGIVGKININGSTTTYAPSSDYRLKENVAPISDGITRLKQLKPSRFNFIADGPDKKVDGFLAHEAQAVVPEAVTGTKDAVEVWKEHEQLPDGVSVGDNKLDNEGNTIINPQGVDQSKLVPLLTAALQEAIAKIETLETKVAALEGE